MAWDDTKVAEDDFLSADWNSMVTDQKTRAKLATPENSTGASCSLTDGDADRVYTLSNTTLTQAGGFFVYVNGLFQHSSQITVTHAASASTIQFIDKLWDADVISMIYMT